MNCPNCGSPVADGSSFCGICGSSFLQAFPSSDESALGAVDRVSHVASSPDQIAGYVISEQSIRSLVCPNCGQSSLEIRADGAFADCSICGSVVDVRNREVTVEHHEHVVNNITYENLGDRFILSGGNSVLEGMTSAGAMVGGSLELPAGQGITVIGDGFCFGNQSVRSLIVPEGVQRIGASAFCNCSNLEKVTLPESLTMIDSSAFENCIALRSIGIPAGVRLGENVFRGCIGLEKATIGNGVIGGKGCFIACSSLREAHLGEDTNVADSMFANCPELHHVVLSNGMTVIDDYGFCDCAALQRLMVPPSLKKIGGAAFRGCSSIPRVDGISSPISVGINAFEDCSSLEEFSLPSGSKLSDGAFKNCTRISRFDLPDDLKVLPPSLFEGCRLLRFINVPEALESIGIATFKGCECLGSFVVPQAVDHIPKEAFMGCRVLTEVAAHPIGLGPSALADCACLRELRLTDVPTVDALKGCVGLNLLQAPMGFFETPLVLVALRGAPDLYDLLIPDFDQGRAADLDSELFGDRVVNLNGVELAWAPWIMQCRAVQGM